MKTDSAMVGVSKAAGTLFLHDAMPVSRWPKRNGHHRSVAGRGLGMVVALMLVLSACSTGTVGESAENRYGEFPLTSLASEASALLTLLGVQEEQYIGDCMRREGFKYFERRPDATVDLGAIEMPELTVEQARQFGYRGQQSGNSEENEDSELDQYLASLGERGAAEWGRALGGSDEHLVSVELSFGKLSVPSDGCLAEAMAQIAGDVETSLRWDASANEIEALRNDAIYRTEADGEVRGAVDEWRQCMHNEGYQVDRFADAFALAMGGDTSVNVDGAGVKDTDGAAYSDETIPPLSEREIEVAVADATCRDASGFWAVYTERLSIYENEVLADNEQVLLDWEETRGRLEDLLADLITRYDLPDASGPGE